MPFMELLRATGLNSGTPASKGCLRLHPDNGFIFNRLVRAAGVAWSWVTVE